MTRFLAITSEWFRAQVLGIHKKCCTHKSGKYRIYRRLKTRFLSSRSINTLLVVKNHKNKNGNNFLNSLWLVACSGPTDCQ